MSVISKNAYELLGNTHDEDSDKEPEPPVKVIDKTPARTTKRNAGGEAPAAKTAGFENRGNNTRRNAPQGNEGAFRDRQAGSANNRTKPTGEAQQDRPARNDRTPGSYGGRGRGGARTFDRHSRTVGGESEKQAAHGWGANEGEAELADETAGEALAKADQKDALTGDAPADDAPVAEPEPEDNSKSYEEYLAELAEKKLALGAGIPEARKPNEGKQDKKWANAKPIAKEDEEDFVAGSGGKTKRVRERAKKEVVEIDQRFVEAPDRGGRGGGFRGGRGRGDGPSRGGRGDGNFRGRGDRGGRGRGDGSFRGARGAPRGGAGSASINTEDTSAFPALG
ncbi:hypothetical protein GLAREA_11861 [Glarea lozoyensis ATCC 20868]|uniref:Hyaluronan/mRNA-binding protein domain-containing protein n=1 Tax=Glarea lozoyensis (strain ATCC 20868 / MF5171) TaxID=1116229 RepID=S3D3U6_GLAL2|nr:uncharacterized protein GLAREA_11861 [Glarea lozoyensis ATCC 20868]EPE31779.1 hypothetical protein GLAREA_11861 [Glarea lozoyensis ATCC 20868]